MCCCFIARQENQEQVHRWDLGSREPSRSDHLSTPWLSRGLGSELPAAVALLGLVPTRAGLAPAWVLGISASVIAQTSRLIQLR